MADKIDMSLDDIIKAKRVVKGKGRSQNKVKAKNRNPKIAQNIRRRPRKNLAAKTRNIDGKWQHDMFNLPNNKQRLNIQTAKNAVPLTSGGPGKLLISNLDFGVSDSDIQELFGEFGPLLSAAVHYDSTGRSLGTAFVIFERRTDAIRGVHKYNNVPLDGRPMNIQMATSDISLLTKNNPGLRTQPQKSFGRGRNINSVNRTGRIAFNNNNRNNTKRRGLSRQSGRPRGGFKGRRGGRGRPTKAGLNAQLDSYSNSRMDTF